MEFKDYLTFLQKLHQELTELNAVEQKKIAAVQAGDLDTLDACMKQEQAATMALRGQEQRRNQLLKQLGLEQIPLRELPRHAPAALRSETQQTVEQVMRAYQVLSSAQGAARTLMESDLRKIERQLERGGSAARKSSEKGPAHTTDFRA